MMNHAMWLGFDGIETCMLASEAVGSMACLILRGFILWNYICVAKIFTERQQNGHVGVSRIYAMVHNCT